MLRVIVEVQIAGQPHAQDLEVPADLPTAELGLLIGKALDANRDAFGRDLRYIVHLLPEVEVMRIKRVVEIEHPGFDMTEAARAFAASRLIHDAACLVMSMLNSKFVPVFSNERFSGR